MPAAASSLVGAQNGPTDDWAWWAYARDWAQLLRNGTRPPVQAVNGPIIGRDEVAYLTGTAIYSRFIGGNGKYEKLNYWTFGSADFVIGSMAVQALINSSRKQAAQRDAVRRWQGAIPVNVVITSARLMCGKEAIWESYPFQNMAEFQPDLLNRTVIFGGGENTPALRLTGPAVPAIALWSAYAIYGDRWQTHPGLAPLLN